MPRQMPPGVASSAKRRRGLSAVEVIALCLVLMVLTAFATVSFLADRIQQLPVAEEDSLTEILRSKYGDARSSEHFEEWLIRDFFQDRREGVFLDVGANHYKNYSNTYFLEASLGWSGVAVDALEEFAAGYAANRPKTRYVAMYASDVADSSVRFFVSDNALVSSSDPEFTKRYGASGKPREVPTTTLNAVLEQAGIDHIDLLSMDIELAEPKALAGFDIRRFRPALVCIEAHPEVRQQILDYFASNGYTIVGKYLRADSHNLYFRPLV
jgi:FkbM family methyltransferase